MLLPAGLTDENIYYCDSIKQIIHIMKKTPLFTVFTAFLYEYKNSKKKLNRKKILQQLKKKTI